MSSCSTSRCPTAPGIDLLRQIRPHKPDLPILILSMHPEEQFAVSLLRADASGYITKDAVPELVVKAIRTLLNGRKYISTGGSADPGRRRRR